MDDKSSTQAAMDIMTEFARLTGLDPPARSPRRYLWTDSFAVCNFLELWKRTGEEKYRNLALNLVDQVHRFLGRHREDDPRKGWISGLDEDEGRQHPTRGGLRIGKKLNERLPNEPFDEQLEWDRDGQYFHYLTKWMHALNRVTTLTGNLTYNRWAVQLAQAAHSRFVYTVGLDGQKRMYWKMSTDLSRPLVPSMGHHDPLDGFITFSQLQATEKKDNNRPTWADLTVEIADMADMCKGKDWATDDTLGLGSLLSDAYRIGQLIARGDAVQTRMLLVLLDASLAGLQSFVVRNTLGYPTDYRLAFRELGLSIGLHAAKKTKDLYERQKNIGANMHKVAAKVEDLVRFVPVGGVIEDFWLDNAHQMSETWMEHRDINMVMLATSLTPDTYLTI
jgi:hypothetical protein